MKIFLPSLCAILLALAPTYQVSANEGDCAFEEGIVQIEEVDLEVESNDVDIPDVDNPVLTRAIKKYTYTNSTTLSPVKVKFVAAIDVQKDSTGKYYIYSATYEKPTVTNSGTSSFQISSVSDSRIDGGRTYVVTATGTFVKDGNNMGTKTVSAFYSINSSTGNIGMS